jgi:hypothetical protein
MIFKWEVSRELSFSFLIKEEIVTKLNDIRLNDL